MAAPNAGVLPAAPNDGVETVEPKAGAGLLGAPNAGAPVTPEAADMDSGRKGTLNC